MIIFLNGFASYLEYVLGVIELLLFFAALFQLARIHLYTNDSKRLLPKKVFHAIIMVTMLLKSLFFFAHPTLETIVKPGSLAFNFFLVWFELSSVFFFLAYFMLLLFWADFYDHLARGPARSSFFHRVRIVLVVFFTILAALVVTLIILAFWWSTDQYISHMFIVDEVSEAIVSVLFLGTGTGFLFYGFRLYFLLKRIRIAPSDGTSSSPPEPHKVTLVATGCTVCFISRAVISLYSMRKSMDSRDDFSLKFDTPLILEVTYFVVTDILPTILMLVFLRRLPKWNGSTRSKN
eukprot:TRINITY_DN6866_c0_g1_i1.p1 TRINITY_DN6866_c0_g1~~TRINITY_DN6866_c0_g1_i1.p1  ORF type:complete len:292 (-),score=23.83 TRINITY_DN6866_c0_g1_i1:63-938(-)